MEINYELEPNDFFQFGKEISPTQSNHKPMVTVYLITFVVFIFADVIFAFFSGTLNEWGLSFLLLSIALRTLITFAGILAVLGIIKLIVTKKEKDVLKESKNGVFCEHRIILTEDEMIELTDVNITRYSWSAIGEILELESFIKIDVLMSDSYIIPKRYFQDEKHINDFLETANNYRQIAKERFQPSHLARFEEDTSQKT